jgi:hypothetical protein
MKPESVPASSALPDSRGLNLFSADPDFINHCDEKHRSANRNMPEPLTFRGTDAKEFPIL